MNNYNEFIAGHRELSMKAFTLLLSSVDAASYY